MKDLRTGKISITSQNHGFAVDPDTVPDDVEITLMNLNDNTVEGIAHKTLPVFSVPVPPGSRPRPQRPPVPVPGLQADDCGQQTANRPLTVAFLFHDQSIFLVTMGKMRYLCPGT